jgi:16S rRNA (guanine966-N2)-methyltransferase
MAISCASKPSFKNQSARDSVGKRQKSTHEKSSPAHTLRIIGGQWRGRKLEFPDVEAIRPTPDRVRETVFNWLQHDIVGARCLDLFAGSGALGFEALSRGASHVTFVDRESRIARYLRETLTRLRCDEGEVHNADALQWLLGPPLSFDIVFLDPPFAAKVLDETCNRLESNGWLAPQSLIYIESPSDAGPPVLPDNWELIKSKTAGQVGYHLARRTGRA